MYNWKNKKVLVTGSEGLIGKELVKLLYELGVEVVTFDKKLGLDIRNKKDIEDMFEIIGPFDYVFHLFGIKGNPKMTKETPIDFMLPMIQGDSNIIEACQKYKVKKMLYTSSIAVENPESDFYPAWAKQTAEHLINAMRIQYPKETQYCIVRPANVYGKEDLNRDNLMVVSSLIKQAINNGKLLLDKKGSEQERDLIHAKDVALGMIKAMEEMPEQPVNLCSGNSIKIKEIAKWISYHMNVPIEYTDLNLILGPQKKIMKNPYIKPIINIEEGIKLCL